MVLSVVPDQAGGFATPGFVLTSQGAGNPPVYKSQLNVPNQGIVVSSSQLNGVSTTALANIPGMAVALAASSTYQLTAYVPVSTNATAGANFAFGTSDTLTASSISYSIELNSAVATANAVSTTLTGSGGTALNIISAFISGIINTNAAGTLVLQAGPIASTSGTASFLVNGYLEVDRVS